MPSLYAYRKVIDTVTTHVLRLPDVAQGDQSGQELATLADGRTVVVLFDGATLPIDQPSAISASIELLPSVLPDLLREQIKEANPHVQLIYERTEALIRAKYSMSDEQKYARIGVGAALGAYTFGPGEQDEVLTFGSHCESARQWGRIERAKLGL